MTNQFAVRSTLLFMLMIVGLMMTFSACHVQTAFAEDTAVPNAVPVPTPDANPTSDHAPQDIARNIYDAVRAGRWMAVIGGVLMLLVWGARAFGKKYWKWLTTPTGGRVLAFGLALLTTLGTALVANQTPNLSLFAGALAAAWVAAGQWQDVKDTKSKPPEATSV